MKINLILAIFFTQLSFQSYAQQSNAAPTPPPPVMPTEVTQTTAGLVRSAGQLLGTNTNDNALPNYVGEIVDGSVRGASPLPGGSNEFMDLTSITLTAGDWEVSGSFALYAFPGYIAGVYGALTTYSGNVSTNVNFDDGIGYFDASRFPTAGSNEIYQLPASRITVSATQGSQTYYLKFRSAWNSGIPTYGVKLTARRVR